MDDLRERLAEAADRVAEQATGPGPAATVRRVRWRRRRAGGGVVLALAVAATLVAVVPFGGQPPAGDPATGRQGLPWRPLEAKEWTATVPDERPLDPVVVAAEGERDGEPWRLVVYRSEHRPPQGRPGTDVCFILDWIWSDHGTPRWGAHGTCAAETQTATVVAAHGGPGAGERVVAVFGRAPEQAASVRLELRGRAPVAASVHPAAPVGRFYVTFVPRAAYLERMVALDTDGRPLGQAPGPGSLSRRELGSPPTGPITVVARGHDRFLGRLTMLVWPVRDGFCLALESEGGGGSSGCGADALEPQPHCSTSQTAGEPPRRLRLVHGGVPRSARTVLVEAGDQRVRVRARDGGELLGRSFFLAFLDPATPLRAVLRVTAFDAGGTRVGTWAVEGCG